MKAQIHILIAAREPEWRAFVAQALRAEGYAVHLSGDARSALQEMAHQNFDLIIVDALLTDLLKTLSKERLNDRLLVVTAAPSVPEAILAYRYGALDYISKMFDVSSLLATVSAVLQKQPVRQRLLM